MVEWPYYSIYGVIYAIMHCLVIYAFESLDLLTPVYIVGLCKESSCSWFIRYLPPRVTQQRFIIALFEIRV